MAAWWTQSVERGSLHSLASAPLPAAAAIQERMQDLRSQWQLLWQLEKDRETSLQELRALAGRFWPGLAKLAGALGNTQRMVLELEDTAASGPKDIQAKLVAMQVQAGQRDPSWCVSPAPEEAVGGPLL